MNYYFFETRLRGYVKDRIRDLSLSNKKTFPHITLTRPCTLLESEYTVKQKVIKYCSGKQPIFYVMEGKDIFDDKFPYVPLVEEEELLRFDTGLEQILEPHVKFFDKLNETKILHTHVKENLDFEALERTEQYMLRMTALKSQNKETKIWFSYDFVFDRVLSREEELDKNLWYATVHEFTKQTGLLPTRQGYKSINPK